MIMQKIRSLLIFFLSFRFAWLTRDLICCQTTETWSALAGKVSFRITMTMVAAGVSMYRHESGAGGGCRDTGIAGGSRVPKIVHETTWFYSCFDGDNHDEGEDGDDEDEEDDGDQNDDTAKGGSRVSKFFLTSYPNFENFCQSVSRSVGSAILRLFLRELSDLFWFQSWDPAAAFSQSRSLTIILSPSGKLWWTAASFYHFYFWFRCEWDTRPEDIPVILLIIITNHNRKK